MSGMVALPPTRNGTDTDESPAPMPLGVVTIEAGSVPCSIVDPSTRGAAAARAQVSHLALSEPTCFPDSPLLTRITLPFPHLAAGFSP